MQRCFFALCEIEIQQVQRLQMQHLLLAGAGFGTARDTIRVSAATAIQPTGFWPQIATDKSNNPGAVGLKTWQKLDGTFSKHMYNGAMLLSPSSKVLPACQQQKHEFAQARKQNH